MRTPKYEGQNKSRTILKTFLEFLFPKTCLGCNQKSTWLCNTCAKLVQGIKQQQCYKCGKQTLFGSTCLIHLKKNPHALDGLLIGAHYNANPILKKAIKALKYYKHSEDIIEKFGQLLQNTMSPLLKHLNTTNPNNPHHPTVHLPILLPVPLHPHRQQERGFNQSKLLAETLYHHLSTINTPNLTESNRGEPLIPQAKSRVNIDPERNQERPLCIDSHLIIRSKNTPPQAQTRSRKMRQQNLRNAFSICKKPSSNRLYILIDDVCSSGTTLEECCKTLKKEGANQVWGLVLARNT